MDDRIVKVGDTLTKLGWGVITRSAALGRLQEIGYSEQAGIFILDLLEDLTNGCPESLALLDPEEIEHPEPEPGLTPTEIADLVEAEVEYAESLGIPLEDLSDIEDILEASDNNGEEVV